jgi:hypothetical protein
MLNPKIRKSDRGFSRHSQLEPLLQELGRKFIPGDVYHVFDHLGLREVHFREFGSPRAFPVFVVVDPDSPYCDAVKQAFKDKLQVVEFSMIPDEEVMDAFIMNPACVVIDRPHLEACGSKELIERKVFKINGVDYDIIGAQTFFMELLDKHYGNFTAAPYHLRWDKERLIDVHVPTGNVRPAPEMDGNGQGDRTRWVFGLFGRKVNSSRWKNIDIDVTLLSDDDRFQCLIETARASSKRESVINEERKKKRFYITSAVRELLNIPAYRAIYCEDIDENEDEIAATTYVDRGRNDEPRVFPLLRDFAVRLCEKFPA